MGPEIRPSLRRARAAAGGMCRAGDGGERGRGLVASAWAVGTAPLRCPPPKSPSEQTAWWAGPGGAQNGLPPAAALAPQERAGCPPAGAAGAGVPAQPETLLWRALWVGEPPGLPAGLGSAGSPLSRVTSPSVPPGAPISTLVAPFIAVHRQSGRVGRRGPGPGRSWQKPPDLRPPTGLDRAPGACQALGRMNRTKMSQHSACHTAGPVWCDVRL